MRDLEGQPFRDREPVSFNADELAGIVAQQIAWIVRPSARRI